MKNEHMKIQKAENKCALCGRSGVPLLQASHRKLGIIMVCQECWEKHWREFVSTGGETCPCG